MHVNITFRHVKSSDALKDYTYEKLERLHKYFDGVVEGHVVLSLEKIRHMVELTLSANGTRMNAKAEDGDFHAAIDKAIAKIERQLVRHKEKLHRHKPTSNRERRTLREQVFDYESFATEDKPRVVETEHYHATHQTIDEAVMELDLTDKDFLVFTDDDDQVKVVYRRPDGNYGLIEP
jgi:putative sigma-54 modulation protein